MLIVQPVLGITTIAFSMLASSCDASFRATPMSLEAEFHSRTESEPESHHPAPCPEQLIETLKLGNGEYLLFIDLDCDGIADLARQGTRQWLLKPQESGGTIKPSGWKPFLPGHLPYRDPGFSDRTAEEWISMLGLHDHSSTQTLWLHEISTSEWTLDVTIPSTSDSQRPVFHDYELGYQWDVLPSTTGPDFETWRVAGDLPEVLRFIFDCGFQAIEASTPAGQLLIEVIHEPRAARVMLDGAETHWIPLEN